MDLLIRIKRCALADRLEFTGKAREEMVRDELTEDDVRECLVFAKAITKTLRSANPLTGRRKSFYVIKAGI